MIIVKYYIEVNNIVSKYKNMSIDIGNHKVSCIKVSMKYRRKFSCVTANSNV